MKNAIQEAHGSPTLRQASRVRVHRVEALDALWARKGEWNALAASNSTNTIFQTFEWQVSWLSAFKDQYESLVLFGEIDTDLIGIAPLVLSERMRWGRKQRVVEFVGTYSSDYCDFIVGHPDALASLLSWLFSHAELWDVLDLSNIAETSPLRDLLPRFAAERECFASVEVLCECPTYIFDGSPDDRKLVNKKSLKRHFNYFRRTGELEFRRCTDLGEITSLLDLFYEQHVRRWHASGHSSLFLDERNRRFYQALARNLVPVGWLHFSVLSFNKVPIAFHFGFEYENRIFWILPTFSTELADHSPGEVLLKHVLEDALERAVAEFDLTVGEEAYKYRFSNHTRLNYAARVYRSALSFYLDRFLLGAQRLLRKSALVRGLRRRLRGR